jgi:hypothetical protein
MARGRLTKRVGGREKKMAIIIIRPKKKKNQDLGGGTKYTKKNIRRGNFCDYLKKK